MDTFWIRGSKFGYVMDTRILDTFWIRYGYVLDTDNFGYALDTLWIDFIDFHGFASILQGLPLAISSDFDGFASILQGVPLRISSNFDGFAAILQRVPLRTRNEFYRRGIQKTIFLDTF